MSSAENNNAARGLAVAQDPVLLFAFRYLQRHGFKLPNDGGAARAWCESAALEGQADAQVVFAELLCLGLYGEESPEFARSWFQTAADAGHPAAQLMLAGYLESESKQQESVSMILKAAAEEYPPALSQLGLMYLNGLNVEKNEELALKFLRIAAEKGDLQGQYLLAVALIKKPGLVEEGSRWLCAAANAEFAGAHRHLGYLYKDGSHGFAQNDDKSRHHFFTATQIEQDAAALI